MSTKVSLAGGLYGGAQSPLGGTVAQDPFHHAMMEIERLKVRVEDLESFLTYAANVHPEMVTEYTVWLKTKRAMGVK